MAFLQMRFALAVLCVVLVHSVNGKSLRPALRDDADAGLSTPELISKYGYPSETHTVTTEDGYILEMHRIPHGKNLPPGEDRPAILVQHGLMSSSADWVIMGPGIAIAYLLADAGYDVWLGNARGNMYARNHVSLDPDKKDFWQFSWHEMGVYDVPAMIDAILEKTGHQQIYYAGYSMGTTMFYVMGSERPEYNAKIKAMFSMAPIAFMSHVKSPLIQLGADFEHMIEWFLELLGGFEFMPNEELLSMLETAACKEGAITSEICTNALFLVCGFDSEELDMAMIPAIMGHVPAGSSTLEFLHYSQEVNSAKFRQYDHGAIKNMLIYGHLEPPDYHLDKVTAPVHLFYSDNDWLAAETDVNQLLNKLGNAVGKHRVSFDKFNHLDYMWAMHGPELVYNDIISLMKEYDKA